MFQKLTRRLRSFLADESGPTSVEYAVMLACIILAAIGAVLSTGSVQKSLWQDNGTVINSSLSTN